MASSSLHLLRKILLLILLIIIMDQSSPIVEDDFKEVSPANTVNINVGVLGHIDSGKTSLCRVLSKIYSTASLDKHPQSQERGITLDLGFSAFFAQIPQHKLADFQAKKYFQYTLVDCPGHASLIRTIIGGAQIIDVMFLVVDVNKGVQTQTAECLVIGEILMQRLIVVLNKVDLIPESEREATLSKKIEVLRKMFAKTKFGSNVPIVAVSANPPSNINGLVELLVQQTERPNRILKQGLLFLVDHCFPMKGQGTVTTGTILQGCIRPGDEVHFPQLGLAKKVKSMQMFKRNIDYAGPGDRVAALFAGLDATQIERGIICSQGMVQPMESIVIQVTVMNLSADFKAIRSSQMFHITSGHQSVMGQLRLFLRPKAHPIEQQQPEKKDATSKIYQDDGQGMEGEFIEEFDNYQKLSDRFLLYALLELETPLLASAHAMIIGSKLDTDLEANMCRIAFHGTIIASYQIKDLAARLRIFRKKTRVGRIERVVDNYTLLVKDLFKKETNVNLFIGKTVVIKATGNIGKIDAAFGKSGKVKVHFSNGVNHMPNQQEEQKNQEDFLINQEVVLVFKKYLFHK